jgi:hypothetical protein
MSNTSTLVRNNETGLTDSTHSSTSSAERYRLDEQDGRPVLCYRYRGRLETSSQKDICAWLDKGESRMSFATRTPILTAWDVVDESLRCTRKVIPRGSQYVDVKRHDLYLPEEMNENRKFPNFDSSLASIKVPLLAYFSRMIFGNYDELYILSPETTPNSSLADSESRRMSPTSSWGTNSHEDTSEGAAAS